MSTDPDPPASAAGESGSDRCNEYGQAIYDAITVCALFRFYNAWIDATGVHDLPAAAYAMSGKRMAEHGYIR